MTSSDNSVKSNILLGALNLFLILGTYLLVLFVGHLFLREVHGVDILKLLTESSLIAVPLMSEMFVFLEFLIEGIIVHTAIFALIYAAYISNYEIRLDKDFLHVKKGFLFIDITKIDLNNVERVYTEKYAFFQETKQLCIKSLDEEIIKIPYVPKADEFKNMLVKSVKEHNMNIETTKVLQEPIRVTAPHPQ